MAGIQRVPWRVQPQFPEIPRPELRITTLLSPVMAAASKFRNVVGTDWTYESTLTASISSFGQSRTNGSGMYLWRISPHTSGPLTIGMIYTPSSVTGAHGLWARSPFGQVVGTPNIIFQRNGADFRVYWGDAFRITISGCFAIGKQANIVISFSNLESGTSSNTVSASVNGVVTTVTANNTARDTTYEYFMSAYNGQAAGAYGEFWSAPQAFSASYVSAFSVNPWQLFAPLPARIWAPPSGVAPTFRPWYAPQRSRGIGIGMR